MWIYTGRAGGSEVTLVVIARHVRLDCKALCARLVLVCFRVSGSGTEMTASFLTSHSVREMARSEYRFYLE